MSNLLITGGAGFIGANFTHYWLQTHPDDAIVVLRRANLCGEPCQSGIGAHRSPPQVCAGRYRNPGLADNLLREHAISRLVHFAAESHVDRSIAGPDLFLHTNVLGTHQLLKATRTVWLDELVGGTIPGFTTFPPTKCTGRWILTIHPSPKKARYRPSSPYAASKAASDHLVRAYHRTYGLPITISNCSNNYGAYQHPEKLIPLVIVHVLEGKPLPHLRRRPPGAGLAPGP